MTAAAGAGASTPRAREHRGRMPQTSSWLGDSRMSEQILPSAARPAADKQLQPGDDNGL